MQLELFYKTLNPFTNLNEEEQQSSKKLSKKLTESHTIASDSTSFSIRYPQDSIIEQLLNKIKDRSEAGLKTYGVPMSRDDVSTLEWLKHAQEEALDLAVYLERIISDLEK